MEARYQLRQSPLRAGLWPVHNLTDITVEARAGLLNRVTSTTHHIQHRLKQRDVSLRLWIAGPFLIRSPSAVIDSMPGRLMPAMLLPWKLHCSEVSGPLIPSERSAEAPSGAKGAEEACLEAPAIREDPASTT
jgi:hypothetical protein